jgi:predicted AlkP superfamily pyrophosphatase or phosphodiesterase
MRIRHRFAAVLVLLGLTLGALAGATAYNGRPKLVVIVIIDQFRADYLERFRDKFGEGGFRLFLDRGAVFTDCYYDYANTRTAPGHATLLTGAYSNGHGIMANEWWDPVKKRMVTSVSDEQTQIIGFGHGLAGASPHNLLGSTLGDELKLATQGKARVFGVSLKDRAAILTGGFSADAAYWIEPETGAWITSSYYAKALPQWVSEFNSAGKAEKYWNLDWKDADGQVLAHTTPAKGKDGSVTGFYRVVGTTPFGSEYQLEFARELVTREGLGSGPGTDLLIISISSFDNVGHRYGPESAQLESMAVTLDRQLAEFFAFLGRQVGLANVWIALSADHGVAPLPAVAQKLRIPAAGYDGEKLTAQLNAALAARLSRSKAAEYVASFDYPLAWLRNDVFEAANIKEADAEKSVGEALLHLGLRGYYTRSQLAQGNVAGDERGRRLLHSYSPLGGWYVLGIPAPYTIGTTSGTDHASPYSYDTHVPLAFYGLAFQPGVYRSHAEPADMAPTLASLLGINAPTHSIGRVLSEALAPPRRPESGVRTPASPTGPATPAGWPELAAPATMQAEATR